MRRRSAEVVRCAPRGCWGWVEEEKPPRKRLCCWKNEDAIINSYILGWAGQCPQQGCNIYRVAQLLEGAPPHAGMHEPARRARQARCGSLWPSSSRPAARQHLQSWSIINDAIDQKGGKTNPVYSKYIEKCKEESICTWWLILAKSRYSAKAYSQPILYQEFPSRLCVWRRWTWHKHW